MIIRVSEIGCLLKGDFERFHRKWCTFSDVELISLEVGFVLFCFPLKGKLCELAKPIMDTST